VPSRAFAFRPNLRLLVSAADGDLRHFVSEYGAGDAPDPRADVEVAVARGGETSERYKTVRWAIRVADPQAAPLRAEIRLAGRPRSFGLSLVQGYFVEPLLSLVAPAAGYVLLPAAGFSVRGRTIVLMGRSRVGKSSVAARMLAAGHAFLGDDQILIDGAGRATRFPRRLRLYSDIAVTAPAAFRSLDASVKASLLWRRAVRTATRGYVAPPVRVQAEQLGRGADVAAAELAVDRVLHVVRADGDAAREEPLTAAAAAATAAALLRLQRAKLLEAVPGLAPVAAAAAAAEREILTAAFASVGAETVVVPSASTAAVAVDLLARRLGV
jgi:hypothetical protein